VVEPAEEGIRVGVRVGGRWRVTSENIRRVQKTTRMCLGRDKAMVSRERRDETLGAFFFSPRADPFWVWAWNDSIGKNASESSTLQLNTKLSNRSWLGDNDDEVDPFAEVSLGLILSPSSPLFPVATLFELRNSSN